MRLLLIAVFIFGLTSGAWATDFATVNNESIQAFIQVFPQYKAIVEKHGDSFDSNDPTISMAVGYAGEVEKLLSKHGMGMKDFPLLMQKITMGLAAAQMEDSGMGSSLLEAMPQFSSVSQNERGVIKNYMPQLKKLFEIN